MGDPSSLPPLGSGAGQVAAADAAGARRPPRADTAVTFVSIALFYEFFFVVFIIAVADTFRD